MEAIAIILVIAGLAAIIISCFMVDKTDKNNGFIPSTVLNQTVGEVSNELLTKELRQKFDEVCQETSEGYLFKLENQLSQLSNEKIIAVHDFSEQILEKIKHNHEEVIFLYNMLGEKEEELKTFIKNADRQKKVLEENIHQPVRTEKKEEKTEKTVGAKDLPVRELQASDNLEAGNNSNQKILELYSNGFSIVDISRTLEIGQGEVKLVVDLYRQNINNSKKSN